MAQTSHIESIRIGDANAHCGNIIGSFNTIFSKTDKGDLIMHWISPLEPNNRHQVVHADRLDRVGDLILKTSQFREWKRKRVESIIIIFYSRIRV